MKTKIIITIVVLMVISGLMDLINETKYISEKKIELLKNELESEKITDEEKQILELIKETDNQSEKINKIESEIKELDLDLDDTKFMETCLKTQIERIVEKKEVVEGYCIKELDKSNEKQVESNDLREDKTGKDIFSLDRLAKAVALHETKDCTLSYGSSALNNCFGIGKFKNGKRVGFKSYETKEDSYEDFKRIWGSYYGGFPTYAMAKKYSGNDRVDDWLRNVTHFYRLSIK